MSHFVGVGTSGLASTRLICWRFTLNHVKQGIVAMEQSVAIFSPLNLLQFESLPNHCTVCKTKVINKTINQE